ncbi:hypothetical protein [Rhodococcus xishaensis]|uniref:Uncharacterized protein n=1 Tax=Rhodococcus xishaensis TaxID=2487364 RepID=A0A438AWD3_9NOCA|nr:hypothetical protein [Rhodococcus xishaensis]RVW03024.1 hypothetical protein EGT50_09960 [Rhodococcus xishaensis]
MRIRSIKPEFWSSPNLPEDPWARLLYMAMWNWADDNGVGTANARELLGFAFPNDEHIMLADVRRMLVEIHRVFGVKFYTVAGRPYYAIPSWEKHQKFDRRSKGKHPGPDEAETWLYQDEHQDSAEARGNPTRPRRDSVAGTGEQGNRGTGEEKTCATPSRDSDPPRFDEFWAAYPRRRDRRKAVKAFAAATKRAEVGTIIEGALRYARDPNRLEQFTKYAEGWLNGDGWLDEPLPSRTPQHSPVSRADEKVRGYLDIGDRLTTAPKELA